MVKHITAKPSFGMSEMPIVTQDAPSHPTLTQKELGAYYTPSALSALLAKWAIRSKNEYVLEPGFGGCGFLEAAVDRLNSLGSKNPKNQLYGCDIDPQAFAYLADKLGVLSLDQRYILSDFVSVFPADFSVQAFDVVIGNPPYVSLHNMTLKQRASVQAWKEKTSIKINGRASLWAYFVLHAKTFLKPGGKMAWVLPGSFLEANYATSLRNDIAACFDEVIAIQLTERMFISVGAEERTVVLLCSGFGGSSKEIDIRHCTSVNQLESDMAGCGKDVNAKSNYLMTRQQITNTRDEWSGYQTLLASPYVVRLGDVCKVLIGTVTGANNFFIMSPSRARQLKLGERNMKPILSKFAHIQGAEVQEKDIENWRELNRPFLLFHIPDRRMSDAAESYITSYPVAERQQNSTFRRRQDWLKADDGRIPDAFFSYMMHDGPRMALNGAAINATNSIHRIYFHSTVAPQTRKLVVISLSSTFSQLSAEKEGRSYGSGVLKVEPSEANKINFLLPKGKTDEQIEAAFTQVDTCFRLGNMEQARQIADEFILDDLNLSDRAAIIQAMSAELEIARNMRRRTRNAN